MEQWRYADSWGVVATLGVSSPQMLIMEDTAIKFINSHYELHKNH